MRKWLILLLLPFSLGASTFPIDKLGTLPVQHEGRIKPIDTVARTSLLIFSGRQSLPSISATEWLAELLFDPEKGGDREIYRIDHPNVLAMIDKTLNDGHFFSHNTLHPYHEKIRKQAFAAIKYDSKQRDSFQNSVIDLWQKMELYQRLTHTIYVPEAYSPWQEVVFFKGDATPLMSKEQEELVEWLATRYQFMDRVALFSPVPPESEKEEAWSTIGKGVLYHSHRESVKPLCLMFESYRAGDSVAFNQALDQQFQSVKKHVPGAISKASFEARFNKVQPFFLSMLFYLGAFIAMLLSLVRWPKMFGRIAFIPKRFQNRVSALAEGQVLNRMGYTFLLVAFSLHTFGVVARMIIEARPPVTNLYSSALFVGWGASLMGILLERIYRNGLGAISSSAIGGMTLIVAQHLAMSGDTMEMMRAVLNSNFWLATHVVTITIGYSAAFLAGLLASFAILGQRIDKSSKQMVYGVICASTFFSLVGTVLGGIWADQSWGRFWGWDPKENGALLLVLWNAAILHASWGGLIRARGLMLMAVGGNIVTSFSWFGVNMLGVGLHSYGFMEGTFFWLAMFMVSQLLIIAFGSLSRGCRDK